MSDNQFNDYFTNFSAGFGNHTINITEVKAVLSGELPDFNDVTNDLFSDEIFSTENSIWWILFIHVAASYTCYIFGKFACKIHIQTISFTLPIKLTIPLTISALIVLCGMRQENVCAFHDMLPDYIFFHMPPVHFLFAYIFKQFAFIWVLWLFSQTWITRHLWNPRNLRNASTERLFVLPMYDSLIIDQSLALNRRREEFGEFYQPVVSRKFSKFEIKFNKFPPGKSKHFRSRNLERNRCESVCQQMRQGRRHRSRPHSANFYLRYNVARDQGRTDGVLEVNLKVG